MHAYSFKLKRAFHSALHFHRKLAKPYHPRLTSARFDLLHAMILKWRGVAEQTEIVKMLGVTRATISRMLRSLLSLGWIQRKRSPRHPRAWIISLTEIGSSLMSRASRHIIDESPMESIYRSAVKSNFAHDPIMSEPEDLEFEAVENLFLTIMQLENVVSFLGDRATFEYGYHHPDD